MIRELTLRCIKNAFEHAGYRVKHIEKVAGPRYHDTIEAFLQGGTMQTSTQEGAISDIFAVCNFVHKNDNPRLHSVEFFNGKDGVMLSHHYESSGDTYVREVEALIKQSGMPW